MMLKVFLSVIFLTKIVFAQSLFEQYPYNDTFTLKDGTQVSLPFHVFDGTTTAILGITNTNYTKSLTWNPKFSPIDIPCQDGKGIAILYLQNLSSSTVGPYNETVNTFMVKRRSAPDLQLPCLESLDDKTAVMQYVLGALQIMGQANADNAQKGLPHDYAMYNQHLVLNSQIAVNAGREIWGYPKELANVNYTVTDSSFKLEASTKLGNMKILDLEYTRIFAAPSPLLLRGDNVLPFNPLLHKKNHAQLDGILATQQNTVGYIMPFIGVFNVGNAPNLTSLALRITDFTPYGVVELTNVEGVAFPLYSKK